MEEKNFYDRNVIWVTALTNFIPGFIFVNFILVIINFRGNRNLILQGCFMTFALIFVGFILFWMLFGMMTDGKGNF